MLTIILEIVILPYLHNLSEHKTEEWIWMNGESVLKGRGLK